MRWLLPLCLASAITCGCKERNSNSGGPSTRATATQLNVAAAADLKFALDEIVALFRKSHADVDVEVTYGSSGRLYSQLANRAPFDLFFSADAQYPAKLADQGLAQKDSEFVYAIGRIVLWVPNDSTLDVQNRGLDALLDPSVKKIAIANPEHAPYGRAAEAALRKHNLWEKLQEKPVRGEDIAQTSHFVQSGSADAGIIALSLSMSPTMKNAGRYYLIAQEDYPPLRQVGVVLSYSAQKDSAASLRQFVLGPEGRRILKQYGFGLPGE